MVLRVAYVLLFLEVVYGYPRPYDYNQGRSVPGTEHSGLNGFGQGYPWTGNINSPPGNQGVGYGNQGWPATVYHGQPNQGLGPGNQGFGPYASYGSSNQGFGSNQYDHGNRGVKSSNQYQHRGGYQEYGY